MDVLDRWSQLVQRPEGQVRLDEAALLISACANPDLDVDAQMERLDSIAAEVSNPQVADLCQVLFESLGLSGDQESYDDPANSYLDQVLDRRRGIPISLAVVMIEVGRRCGVKLEGVGMPGHFLVRDPSSPSELIDAFNGGRRLDRDECERLLQSVTGATGGLTPEMLATTGPRAILARMLANLDASFMRRNDRVSLSWLCELRTRLPGASVGDRTQLASRLAVLGRFDVAASVLEEACGDSPSGRVRDRMLAEATSLRARLN